MPVQHGDRKPNRAPGFDYHAPGPYFVTVCVQDRRCLFGTVRHGEMLHSDGGHIVADVWSSLLRLILDVHLDSFVVMPNHVHAIIQLPTDSHETGPTLGFVLQTFKRLTTHAYVKGVKTSGWPRFDGRLWQRRFHDHIVRNERDMERLREYIAANPGRWAEDRYHALP